MQKGQAKMPSSPPSPVSPWKRFDCKLSHFCLRLPCQISLHKGSDYDPSGSLKELMDTSHLCLPAHATVKLNLQPLPGRSLFTCLAHQLLQLPPKGLAPKLPISKSCWGSAFTNKCGITQTKKSFYMETQILPLTIPFGSAQSE